MALRFKYIFFGGAIHLPPWPNGYGVGLTNQRTPVRVLDKPSKIITQVQSKRKLKRSLNSKRSSLKETNYSQKLKKLKGKSDSLKKLSTN